MPELKGSVLFPAADNLLLNGPITRQPGLCLAARRQAVCREITLSPPHLSRLTRLSPDNEDGAWVSHSGDFIQMQSIIMAKIHD